jgi:hypothetical protein
VKYKAQAVEVKYKAQAVRRRARVSRPFAKVAQDQGQGHPFSYASWTLPSTRIQPVIG